MKIITDFESKRNRIAEQLNWHEEGSIVLKGAKTACMELSDVIVVTQEKEIRISGTVFVVSTKELIKLIKNRYMTDGGRNEFPEAVDNYLAGQDLSFKALPADNRSRAKHDLMILGRIYRHGKGFAILSEINPYSSVEEYSLDGKLLTSTTLREISLPAVITGQARPSSFARAYASAQNELRSFDVIVRDIENDIITLSRGKNYSAYADLTAVVGAIFLILGIGFLAARGKLWEIGLPMALIGGYLLWLRFLSNWSKEKFSSPSEESEGVSSLIVDAYGHNE